MTRYPAFLEMADDGPCIVHVLDLPGCFVRATTPEQALERLPEAIEAYHAWLRRHGEPAPAEGESIEIELAAEWGGYGACRREDKAALFPPEYEPLTEEDLQAHFRLMTHSRSDLLELAQDLPDSVLDWQPHPDDYSVRGLLRHIGSAEQWYVSRIVPLEALPSEWENDEDMPTFEFLEMERRTALARLRQLTEEERAGVYHPSHWTNQPDEAWTARKALRRFLEHEREHIAQIRDILAMQRYYLLARLSDARADLLQQFLGLDEPAMTTLSLHDDDGWVLKDALAHIVGWDRWVLQELRRGLAGQPPDITTVRDIDGYNAASAAAWRDRSLAEVVAELHEARAAWTKWMADLPLEDFFRSRPVGRGDWFSPTWIHVLGEHEVEHAAEAAAWRRSAGLVRGTGPGYVLEAVLLGARAELLAAVDLVPAAERAIRPVCGEWTLQDVLGHIADWEWLGAEGLRLMAAGRDPQVEHVKDLDGWNQAHVQAHRGQPWADVWTDLQAAREAFLEALGEVDAETLGRAFPAPWGEPITPYDWVCIYVEHDRDHARDVHKAIIGGTEEPSGG